VRQSLVDQQESTKCLLVLFPLAPARSITAKPLAWIPGEWFLTYCRPNDILRCWIYRADRVHEALRWNKEKRQVDWLGICVRDVNGCDGGAVESIVESVIGDDSKWLRNNSVHSIEWQHYDND
jgi:hypothetical protein